MPVAKSPVFAWFHAKYGKPTPAQRAAWPRIRRGESVLIASPTGTGKTFAAFLAVLDALATLHATGELQDTIYGIYVSPLRALNYDLEKNLAEPLREIFGEQPPIRIELRTGDTSGAQRARQYTKPPHLLLTTPESLCLLLSQEKWLRLLATVRWVIVDEIHALADSKRGAHLALSLARLDLLCGRVLASGHPERSAAVGAGGGRREVEGPGATEAAPPAEAAPFDACTGSEREQMAPGPSTARRPSFRLRYAQYDSRSPLQRIGLSATIAPLDEIAQFLVGTNLPCEVIDVSAKKRVELSVYTPLRKDPYPAAGFTGQRLVRELGELIGKHQTTLVFSNTRSGAEGTSYWLKLQFPELADRIECHHASLERDVRREVEDRLKRGELRAVVCSTSLELGIDIGSVELVVMMSTPKGVSKALQRAGRAGHNIHSVSRGVLMATNMSDLVESCATVLLARRRHLDLVRIPVNPLDVLAQHLVSMGCTQRWERQEAFALVRTAYPFHTLSEEEFDATLDYLAGGGASLRRQYSEVFGKIELDDDGFVTRSGRVQREFLQNVGVIPNVGQVRVRSGGRNIGTVEEMFIRQLKIGDVFVFSGRAVRLDKVSQMEATVTRVDGATPTVPRWNAAKFSLANRVAEEIVAFRGELRARLGENRFAEARNEEEIHWIAERLDCGTANAGIIHQMHVGQMQVSEIPTADCLLIEELVEYDNKNPKRRRPHALHYFFHSLIGRSANDALSRVVVLRLNELRGGNAVATPHDYGFVITVEPRQTFTEADLPALLRVHDFDRALRDSLRRSPMLRFHFRNAAQTGLMVYRNFHGEQKSVRKLAWSSEVIFNVLQEHEPEHILLREALRDTLRVFLDAEGATAFLEAQQHRPVKLRRVEKVPPLSFAMFATKIKEAVMIEDPFEMQERLFHQWWGELSAGSAG